MNLQYILDTDGEPEPCTDLIVWAVWMETADRTVLRDVRDNVIVSTIFLGLDHNHTGQEPPVLWETMAFTADGKALDEYSRRYTSRLDALEGHWLVLQEIEQEHTKP